jgi:long-chain acyl-CoA synthetase
VIGPLEESTIASFLERAVDAGEDALVERPFEELAARWRALGLRPGDLVLLSLPTGVALLQHFFGVLAAGGVPALLAPGTPSARLREMARVMGARAISAVRLPGARPEPPARLETVGRTQVAWLPAEAEPAASPGEVVLLTSGTSGFSSGCVFDFAALLRNGERHAEAVGQRPEDTVLISLPLHFSFALVAQTLGTLQRGGRLVIAGPPFHPEAYARALTAHEVAITALTPVLVRMLFQRGAAFPPGPRTLTVGGDGLAAPHVAELLRLRPDRELYVTYGLTQAGPRVATLAAHREPEHRHGSVGLPLPGTRVALHDLGDGSGRQELLVASDTLMRRRIGLVEGRSSDDFRAPGLLATGDVFTMDADGYLTFRARLSEYIVRGGEKVCLATVRRVATQLPGVISARTRVAFGAEGEDFDLSLVFAGVSPLGGPEPYRALLARSLRRGELPRAIEIVADQPAFFGHK